MLSARAKGFLQRIYEIYEGDRFVTSLEMSSWKESASVELGGRRYRFEREKTLSGPFLLLEVENVVAFAEKPSAMKDRFVITYSGRFFEMRKPSVWKDGFELEESGKVLGTVASRGFFRREYNADLPDELPPIVRLFILWLALVIARRAEAAVAAS